VTRRLPGHQARLELGGLLSARIGSSRVARRDVTFAGEPSRICVGSPVWTRERACIRQAMAAAQTHAPGLLSPSQAGRGAQENCSHIFLPFRRQALAAVRACNTIILSGFERP